MCIRDRNRAVYTVLNKALTQDYASCKKEKRDPNDWKIIPLEMLIDI